MYVCVVFSSLFVCASVCVCVCAVIMVDFILVNNPGVIHTHNYNQWLLVAWILRIGLFNF